MSALCLRGGLVLSAELLCNVRRVSGRRLGVEKGVRGEEGTRERRQLGG